MAKTKGSQKDPKQIGIARSIGRLLHRFGRNIAKRWFLITAALFFILVSVGFRLLEPWPLKFIVDGLTGADGGAFFLIAHLPMPTQMGILALAILAIVIIHTGAAYLSKVAIAFAMHRIMGEVRSDLFAHLQRMSLASHRRFNVGDLSNRLSVDVERLRLASTNNAVNFIVNALSLLGMLVIMFWINPELAVIAMASMPVFYFFTGRMTRAIALNAREHRASDGAVSNQAVSALGAVKTIQGLSLERSVGREFDEASETNLRFGTRGTLLKVLMRQGVSVLVAACIALVVWRGALLAQSGAITAGDLIVFLTYLRETMEKPMRRFTENLSEIARAAASGERVLACLDQGVGPVDRAEASAAPPRRGRIRFENVSFQFDGGQAILDNASFEIAAGERVAVVGPSGSGKSTILSLLLRFYEPSAGRILIDGVDIRDYRLSALRGAQACVFQDSVVFNMSIAENLRLCQPDAPKAALWRALRLAGADDFVLEKPGRLDAMVSAQGSDLSGGQRQRLAIARAALMKTPILLLDEPTSALDPESRAAVDKALGELGLGKTVLQITHQTEGLDQFDRVLTLHKGRLTAAPPPAALSPPRPPARGDRVGVQRRRKKSLY